MFEAIAYLALVLIILALVGAGYVFAYMRRTRDPR